MDPPRTITARCTQVLPPETFGRCSMHRTDLCSIGVCPEVPILRLQRETNKKTTESGGPSRETLPYEGVGLSVCFSACLPACLPVCLPACLPVWLLVCSSVCLFVCPSVGQSARPSACLPVCLPACLSVCPSARLLSVLLDKKQIPVRFPVENITYQSSLGFLYGKLVTQQI